jgi:hypothetical protein
MSMFERHFTLAEANALLPTLRRRLARLQALDARLEPLCEQHGAALGEGLASNVGGAQFADYLKLSVRWRVALEEIFASGVQVKDVSTGLCDFPHLLPDGREVLLCWQANEREVSHWHTIEGGFAARRPIEG